MTDLIIILSVISVISMILGTIGANIDHYNEYGEIILSPKWIIINLLYMIRELTLAIIKYPLIVIYAIIAGFCGLGLAITGNCKYDDIEVFSKVKYFWRGEITLLKLIRFILIWTYKYVILFIYKWMVKSPFIWLRSQVGSDWFNEGFKIKRK